MGGGGGGELQLIFEQSNFWSTALEQQQDMKKAVRGLTGEVSSPFWTFHRNHTRIRRKKAYSVLLEKKMLV